MTLSRSSRRAGSSRVGRGGKFNRIKTFHEWTLEPASGGGTRVEFDVRDRAARCRPTGCGGARLPRAGSGAARQGAQAPAVDPRGGPRPRRAGDGRRACRLARADDRSPPSASLLVARLAVAARSPSAGLRQQGGDRTSAETEGIYLDLGDLKYQVQISRCLNPADTEDSSYLRGLPAGSGAARRPTRSGSASSCASRTRPTSRSRRPTRSRSSTPQDDEYQPRRRSTSKTNPFVYRAGLDLPAGTRAPRSATRRRPELRSRARCCSSSSRPSSLRTARSSCTSRHSRRAPTRATVDLDV